MKLSNQTLRDAANPHEALRRDRKRREAENRERIERSKELGSDAPLSADDFKLALKFVRDKFDIVLNSSWVSHSIRPKITARELFALCVSVEDGTTYRDRVLAVRRLSRLGFRVSFTENGPRPALKRC